MDLLLTFVLLSGSSILDSVMIFFAESLVWLLPITLLYLWFGPEDTKPESVFIFVTVVVGLLISYGLGLLYSHPAPYMVHETLLSGAPENSFPSQHTTVMFAFAWPWFYFGRLRTGFVVLCLALLVGVGRIYVGFHYPLDVFGGIVASLLGFALVYLARDAVATFADFCVRVEHRLWAVVSTE